MRRCSACKNGTVDFDHKDQNLVKFLSNWGRIKSGKETRLCSKHQRNLTRAIKRARFLALVPYTNR
ncbi:MAG: 30S ribosomal protein S18 [bacterium]